MAGYEEDLRTSNHKTNLSSSHSCIHCQVPLSSPQRLPRRLFRIRFPQTIRQAREASRDGCPIFEQLLSIYDHRSLFLLFRTHLLSCCSCCGNTKERLRHLFRSLSRKPFQLAFLPFLYGLEPASMIHSFAHFDCGNGATGTRFNAYTYTGDDAASILPSFDLKVDTVETINDVKKWLSSCSCSRASGDRPFRPKRIVDLGELSSPEHITVRTTLGVSISAYVCLSYCWGGPQALVCKSRNFESSQYWTVPDGSIPATFRDAFKVTRLLGFRYIWIDSLCILQDDPEDVESEILQMPHIFKNADLTICASSSQSCREEFLNARPDYSEKKIRLRLPGGRLGTVHLDSFPWGSPPVPEPLGQRAWAFQERLLSPRVLEYGWRTARWICSCCNGYSGFTKIPSSESLSIDLESRTQPASYNLFMYLNPLGIRHLPLSSTSLFVSWCAIVNQYSALKLSFPKDRLAAIGGIAAELQRKTNVRYLAGLWDHERLPSLLQWGVVSPLCELRPRPRETRAPSWSWAGIDDEVVIQQSNVLVETFKILSVDVAGGFGMSASGFIEMKGPVRRGLWWRKNGNFQIGPEALVRHDIELIIWPDCTGEIVRFIDGKPTILETELTLLAIGRAHSDQGIVRGLMLTRKEPKKEQYTRVAMFQVRDRGGFWIKDWDIETITVI